MIATLISMQPNNDSSNSALNGRVRALRWRDPASTAPDTHGPAPFTLDLPAYTNMFVKIER